MQQAGYALSVTGDSRGEGVIATRRFNPGETVVVGEIERRLPGNHSHATQVGIGQYVLLGGFGSKVNHSCDPNCGVRVNASGAPDLVARRNIEPGEEITFDYAMRNYSIEHFPSSCLCGAAGCRGTITGWKDLPPDRKAAYQGLIAPYLLDLEQRTRTREPNGLILPPGDADHQGTTTLSIARGPSRGRDIFRRAISLRGGRHAADYSVVDALVFRRLQWPWGWR